MPSSSQKQKLLNSVVSPVSRGMALLDMARGPFGQRLIRSRRELLPEQAEGYRRAF